LEPTKTNNNRNTLSQKDSPNISQTNDSLLLLKDPEMKKRRELSFESIDRESVNHHHFQSRIKVNHETSDGPASPSPSQRLVLRLSRHQKSVFAILPSPVCEPSYSPVGVQK
ncbi:hypothetical protein E1A91_A07G199600v1, partial [Gossypium mustelinum]